MNSHVTRWRRAAAGLVTAAMAAPLILVGGQPAQAADTFQCTGAASLVAADTSGVLWRIPLNSPGTSTTKLGTKVSFGSGWNNYGRVLGGPNGRVYAINSTGLWRYRWNGSTWDTVDGKQNLQLHTGFTQYATAAYRNKITVDEIGDFYLIDANGRLRWYRYDENTRTWPVFGRLLDSGWDRYDLIVAGGPGVLYARTPAGKLYRYRYEATSQRWIQRDRLVGTGWQNFPKGVVSVGGDTLLGIQADGDLINYRHREDTSTWPVQGPDIGDKFQQYANVTAWTDACRLTDRHIPARPDLTVQQYGTSTVVQGPATGTAMGAIEYLHTDNIGRLRHGYQPLPDNFNSIQWATIPSDQAFTGRPAVVANAQGVLRAAVHNANSDVWSFTRAAAPSTAWDTGLALGGAMRSSPALVRLSDGSLTAFALDADGALWVRPQDGTAGDLLPWNSLGGSGMTGDPYALATSDRSVLLVVSDASGTLQTATYKDGTLSAWTSLGGSGFSGSPAVVTVPGPSLRIFARSAEGLIVTQRQNSSGAFPGVWTPVGSFEAAGSPAAILDPVLGRVAVVARGTDNEVYRVFETTQGSDTWGDWAPINTQGSDPAATDPTVAPLTNSSGQSWVIVYRNVNDATRVYDREIPAASGAALRRATPEFARHALPAPPRD
ncbi:tachylectin-related carbohydrate-binding protein [Actinoplanes sp. NPDC026623]|uniref:tachylectin-related carbohydrate-binding protein n=1 Tax=Actinoplanes sp. NPDC026623 TaxID=3155610 RepID=UPI0033FE2059